jgi:hypothetical protein
MRSSYLCRIAALVAGITFSAGLASAANFSFTGTFLTDDETESFTIVVPTSTTVLIRTWSYAGGTNAAGQVIPRGGFDPIVSLFDSNGVLMGVNDDGGALVAVDPKTSAHYDSYLSEPALPAGTYTVVLTQNDNFPNGPYYSSGFHEQDAGNFTAMYTCSNMKFCDDTFVALWNNRTGNWALDIDGVTSAVPDDLDVLQIGYAANLAKGDSYVDITNAGTFGGSDPGGDICANVYVFAQDQQLIECCSCPLTPNHLVTLSVQNDLTHNNLTPGVPTAISIEILASIENGGTCDAASVLKRDRISGMRAWGTTIHQAAGKYQTTEREFSQVSLSASEFLKMTTLCSEIEANGSGFGICNSCTPGAQGASKK